MKAADLASASLTSAQRKLIEWLGKSSLRDAFYLSGGTALAGFYAQHRLSKDLDFFTREDVPLETVRSFLATVPGLVVESFDRRIFLLKIDDEPLEVEFTRYDFEHLAQPTLLAEGVAIDSPTDILANKIAALADRRDPKDEVDLFFLLADPEAPPFGQALELAQRKFGIPGLRYIMQSRLLAVSKSHPSTTPPVTRSEIEARFRALVEQMVGEDSQA